MRTGSQYLESLKDGREVVIDGKVVKDVTTHPAFEGVTRTVAGLYDHVNAHPEDLTFTSPKTGQPVALWHQIPRSRQDLVRRRKGIAKFTELSYGMIGRGPDCMGSFFAGFASSPEIFAKDNPEFGENVVRFHEKIRDEHLWCTVAIIPPQVDRSKTAHEIGDHIVAGVFEERDDGIVIRGAQMLATGSAISDYLHLSCVVPLRQGDEKHAISLAVPIGAPGLRLYSRRGYGAGHPSTFDYPLSTRFDETDSLAVFHDVFVPWKDVFVFKNIQTTLDQWHETAAHVLGNNQAQIRLVTKTKFLVGLGRKIAETNAIDKIPSVQWHLGELASWASLIEGMVLASEAEAVTKPNGVVIPHPRFLYGAIGLQYQLYPKIISLVRELAGGGVIQVPSSVHEYKNPDTAGDIKRYIKSPKLKSEEKVKLFKLAWDIIGSEFAGRHTQYEMFYIGAPFVSKSYAYRKYDFSDCVDLVNRCLEGYDMEN